MFSKETPLGNRTIFIKPEDAKRWVEWLKEHRENPVYWQLATFMLLTGTRVGEACGLKWDAIDLEQGIVRIVRRVRWGSKNQASFSGRCNQNFSVNQASYTS